MLPLVATKTFISDKKRPSGKNDFEISVTSSFHSSFIQEIKNASTSRDNNVSFKIDFIHKTLRNKTEYQ